MKHKERSDEGKVNHLNCEHHEEPVVKPIQPKFLFNEQRCQQRLHSQQYHVQVEDRPVLLAYTVIHKDAMVVEGEHTSLTLVTVAGTRWLILVAEAT